LLDEPIAHLDAKLRHRMYAELKRIQRERGITTVYATPAQTEAMAMADRVVVIFQGGVQQIGTPRDLYERPVSVAVAKFGGEQMMNILPAQLLADSGTLWFQMDGSRVPVPDHALAAVQASNLGQEVLLGVRPPDVRCAMEPMEGAFAGELYAVEHSGRAALVTVKVGEQLIEAVSDSLSSAVVGTPIWLSLEGCRLYLFDGPTTKLAAAVAAC